MTRRRGAATIAEVLMVFTLFALVLTAIAGFVASQGKVAAAQRDRVRALEAIRTVAAVIGAEVRTLAPEDILAQGPDSLRLRAVRGSGVVCDGGGSALVLRYRGIRLPDAAKDSVLLVRSGVADSVYAVSGVAHDSRCADGVRIDLGRPAPGTGFGIVFETGTYHLRDHAVRYRRGAGGRQPITEAILDTAWFEATPSALRILFELDGDSLRRLPSLRRTAALHMLNGTGAR